MDSVTLDVEGSDKRVLKLLLALVERDLHEPSIKVAVFENFEQAITTFLVKLQLDDCRLICILMIKQKLEVS